MRGVPKTTIGLVSRCEPSFLGYVAWEQSGKFRHRGWQRLECLQQRSKQRKGWFLQLSWSTTFQLTTVQCKFAGQLKAGCCNSETQLVLDVAQRSSNSPSEGSCILNDLSHCTGAGIHDWLLSMFDTAFAWFYKTSQPAKQDYP